MAERFDDAVARRKGEMPRCNKSNGGNGVPKQSGISIATQKPRRAAITYHKPKKSIRQCVPNACLNLLLVADHLEKHPNIVHRQKPPSGRYRGAKVRPKTPSENSMLCTGPILPQLALLSIPAKHRAVYAPRLKPNIQMLSPSL